MPWRLVLTIAAVLLVAAPARAQMTGDVERLKVDLYGNNIDKAVAAASALGSLKTTAAREALLAAMHLGAPPKLLIAMLEALGLHRAPDTLYLLKAYAEYRDSDIRVSALKAMGPIKDPRVPLILMDALGDSNPIVRARAARLLGERRERRAERALFRLLVKGDISAAGPLGAVGGVATAMNLAELIGEVPDRAIAVAFGEMLRRLDFGPDPLRTEIVTALCGLPGADATTALAEYLAFLAEKAPREQRQSKSLAERCLTRRQK